MEKVKALAAYSYMYKDDIPLCLQIGRVLDDNGKMDMRDSAIRYLVISPCSPIPVRCGTWFVGLPRNKMHKWFNNIGFKLVAKTNLCTGVTKVAAWW